MYTKNTLLKSLSLEQGELYVTTGGVTTKTARTGGRVEIIEHTDFINTGAAQNAPIREIRGRLVLSDIEYIRSNAEKMYDGMCFTVKGGVFNMTDECHVLLTFAGLRLVDTDPLKKEMIFSIEDLKLVENLFKFF